MLAWKSPGMANKNLGVSNGGLSACGTKPNCVSSQADPNSDFYIEPITSSSIEETWAALQAKLKDLGLKVINVDTNYLHCEAVTPLMRFVDDVEFYLNLEGNEIQVRSQSRVGYSDLGANRKRIEKIRKSLL